ncbi:NAD-dependent epimerase/dehydratase [Streptomyces sp. N2-109]|uniref:NAD-dependent epimerase/dehydratase n=1 Tax=Streptomyces gossypii TaxID=2883101 RepID=A0ABT2JZD5_9ACTN|nr:NAD-dependent epimerase/dehydratase [Streptomyces gossypii]MCT2593265.1 NAD-dependent epimerase/dehydratase [Streptomyces gossypii]
MTATSATPRPSVPLITVLGASGFIGSAVTAALARRDIRLRAVARGRSTVPLSRGARVEIRTADLTDRDALAAAVEGSDAVIHLLLCSGGWRAAEEDPGSERVNVGVMRDLVDVLRNRPGGQPPPLVLYSGAASQVGVPPERPLDGTERDAPETAYDRQKLAAERALLAATAEGVVRGISLRLPTVFGQPAVPGVSDRGVVSAMVRRALGGQELTMWHDGTVRRDLVHIDDVASAFLSALDHPEELIGGHWPIGAGRGDPLGDVFRTIAQAVSERTGAPPVPVVSVPPPAHAPVTDFRSVTINSSKFRAATGWRPRVSIHNGVVRTVGDMAGPPSPSPV